MTDVTVVQCLGLIAIYFLLADMFCWMQWAHAPMSQRPGPFRRALLGVAYAAMWGGVWAFLQFSAGARPEGPRVQWWIATGIVLGALISLGFMFWKLRQSMSLRRVSA